jgi:Sulfotransferase family
VNARSSPFIDAPLVLISQIPRSGGSLLAQLFDGHPQLYAHPWELRICHPERWSWPQLDPDGDGEEWFGSLYDWKWAKIAEEGFAKAGRNPFAKQERHPFTFYESEQRVRFLELVASRPIDTARNILDCYFTSFFASWQEWQPTGREVALTGFIPRLAGRAEGLEAYARDYPDGRLITILRDPRSWYASSQVVHFHKASRLSEAIAEWVEWAERFAALLDGAPVATLGILFDDLVLAPEAMMRRIAGFIGIEFDQSLLRPSYAGRPVLPNSSFAVAEYGINPEMAQRRDELPNRPRSAIEAEALPLYEQLAERVGLDHQALSGS